jgi:putative ABC transport system permease protein
VTRDLALRAIAQRPFRALLSGIAIALGIAIVLGVAVTVTGLGNESQMAAQAAAGASSLDVRVTAGTGLSAEDAGALATLPGVSRVAPLYAKRVIARISDKNINGVTVDVVALRDGSVALRPLSLSSGRMPVATSHSEVVIDTGFAGVLATDEHTSPLRLGDRLQLTTTTGPDQFTIVGFSNGGGGGSGAFTRSAVYVTETSMLGQFRLGLRTALVAMALQPGSSPATVAGEVLDSLGTGVTTVDPRGAGANPLQEVQPLLLLITVLSVAVGAGATATGVALSVSERRREVGLLRAAGASMTQVFRLFMLEVLILALAAVPFGVAGGIGLAALLEAHLTPADLPVPSLDVTLVQVVLAAFAGVGAALAGGALAALGTGRSILAGLRPHPGSDREPLRTLPLALAPPLLLAGFLLVILASGAGAAAGALLVLAGVLSALPLVAPIIARVVGVVAGAFTPLAGVAGRNLVRRRNRTALTLSGLTIAVASAVAVSALAVGAVSGGDGWISHLFAGDVVVRSPVAQTDAVASSLGSATGVRAALPLRFLTTASGSSVLGVTSIEASGYVGGTTLDVTSPTRAEAFRQISDSAAFLAPQALASQQNWQVGDSVKLSTAHGSVPFTVAGIVQHSFPAGNGAETLLIDRGEAMRYFGATAGGFDDLDVLTGGNTAGITNDAASFGLSAVTVADIQDSAQRSLQHALGLLFAVAVIALVISMIAVANTLVVNVRQGQRELSLMRAVGLDRSGALRLVLTEAGILAVSGAVLGVATGCLLVAGMLHAVASPGFAPDFEFPTVAALAVVAAVVGGSLLATLVPAMRSSRSSIVAAIRQD